VWRIILAYCGRRIVGGRDHDFLQAVILMPFTLVLLVVSLARRRHRRFIGALPPPMKSLALPGTSGWGYVAAWAIAVSFGYNTSVMAQRISPWTTSGRPGRCAALLRIVPGRIAAVVRAVDGHENPLS
jgi:hypothetical protein